MGSRPVDAFLCICICICICIFGGCRFEGELPNVNDTGVDHLLFGDGGNDVESSPGDAARDTMLLADLPLTDAPLADLPLTDAPLADLPLTDAPLADLPPADAPGTVSCAAGFTRIAAYSDPSMVICEAGSGGMTQCEAEASCAPDAHLCSAAEYLARGGTETVSSIRAWVGGCVRSGGPAISPFGGLCSSCSLATGSFEKVMWDCADSGDVGGVTGLYLGLITATICQRVGIDDPSTAGYWWPFRSASTIAGALCCR